MSLRLSYHGVNLLLRRVALTIILLLATNQAGAKEVITLANGQWPPFQSPDLPGYGVTSYFVVRAFQKVDIDVKYKFYPWARGLMMAQTGEVDGTLAFAASKERDEYFIYSNRVLQQDRFFFHRQDVEFDWQNFTDLKGKKFGIIRGFIYGKNFDDAVQQRIFTIEEVATDRQNLVKVLKGWIDATPIDIPVANRVLKSDFTPKERALITYHPKAVYQYNYMILFSKKVLKNPRLMEQFNEGLKALTAEIGEQRLLHPCDDLDHLDQENLSMEDRRVIKGSCP